MLSTSYNFIPMKEVGVRCFIPDIIHTDNHVGTLMQFCTVLSLLVLLCFAKAKEHLRLKGDLDAVLLEDLGNSSKPAPFWKTQKMR